MRAFAGIAGLFIVLLAWASLPAANPRVITASAGVQQEDSLPEQIPPYIHLDPYDWR